MIGRLQQREGECKVRRGGSRGGRKENTLVILRTQWMDGCFLCSHSQDAVRRDSCTVLEIIRSSLPMFTMYSVTTATRTQGARGKLEVDIFKTVLSC